MSQVSDDTAAFAEKIAESDECQNRMYELIEDNINNGFEQEPEDVVETLHTEFIENDSSIQNDVPGFGGLLEAAFKKRVSEMYRDELEQILLESE